MSLYANVYMADGLGQVTRLFASTLKPLTETQIAHMKQVQSDNTEIFSNIPVDMVMNFTHIWNDALDSGIVKALNSSNFTTQAVSMGRVLIGVGQGVDGMRDARYHVMMDLDNATALATASASAGTTVNETVVRIVNGMVGYYNFTALDQAMRLFNVTLASSVPPEQRADAAPYLASLMEVEWKTESLISTSKWFFEQVVASMDRLFHGLTFGVRRCDFGISSQQSVPNDGMGLMKFGTLVDMLSTILQFGIPVLYGVAAIMILSTLGGGIAWTTKSYAAFYWYVVRWRRSWLTWGFFPLCYRIASFFVLGMIGAWVMNGFMIPAAVVASDACSNGTFFNGSSVVQAIPFRRDYTALRVPTCASCEKNALFVGWDDFQQDATEALLPVNTLEASLSAPTSTDPDHYVPGPYQLLMTLESLANGLSQVKLDKPSGRSSWDRDVNALRRSLPANETELLARANQLDAIGKSLVDHTQQLYNSFQVLKVGARGGSGGGGVGGGVGVEADCDDSIYSM